jgi:hypothetical protein
LEGTKKSIDIQWSKYLIGKTFLEEAFLNKPEFLIYFQKDNTRKIHSHN